MPRVKPIINLPSEIIKITIKQTTVYKFHFKLYPLCDRYYVALWEPK